MTKSLARLPKGHLRRTQEKMETNTFTAKQTIKHIYLKKQLPQSRVFSCFSGSWPAWIIVEYHGSDLQGMPWTSWISIKLLQHEQLYISNQQPCFIRHSARRSGGLEREKRAKNLGCWKTFGLYGVEGMSKCGSLKYRLRNNHFILYTLFVLCHFYANTARICTTFAIKKVKGNMW